MGFIFYIAAIVLAILKAVDVGPDNFDFGWVAVACIAAGLLVGTWWPANRQA